MAIDLDKLGYGELDALIAKAEKQKTKIHREQRDAVKKKLIKIAKDEGYTIEELFGGGCLEFPFSGKPDFFETFRYIIQDSFFGISFFVNLNKIKAPDQFHEKLKSILFYSQFYFNHLLTF